MADDLLKGVHPLLCWAITEIQREFENLKKPIRVTQGLRTAEYQHQLWRQGREVEGRIVTNCDGYVKKSNHQAKADGWGHAVDICFVGPDPYLDKDPDRQKWWSLYGSKVESKGLKWGGHFKLVDYPHAELP